jgi:hypothetical protein
VRRTTLLHAPGSQREVASLGQRGNGQTDHLAAKSCQFEIGRTVRSCCLTRPRLYVFALLFATGLSGSGSQSLAWRSA